MEALRLAWRDPIAAEMVERAAALLLSSTGGEAFGGATDSPGGGRGGALPIDDGLWIGPFSTASDLGVLARLGISAVLSVDASKAPLFELEMADVRALFVLRRPALLSVCDRIWSSAPLTLAHSMLGR